MKWWIYKKLKIKKWIDDEEDKAEPENVTKAWEELMLIQREQQRLVSFIQGVPENMRNTDFFCLIYALLLVY